VVVLQPNISNEETKTTKCTKNLKKKRHHGGVEEGMNIDGQDEQDVGKAWSWRIVVRRTRRI
jgi:hypothetical protein